MSLKEEVERISGDQNLDQAKMNVPFVEKKFTGRKIVQSWKLRAKMKIIGYCKFKYSNQTFHWLSRHQLAIPMLSYHMCPNRDRFFDFKELECDCIMWISYRTLLKLKRHWHKMAQTIIHNIPKDRRENLLQFDEPLVVLWCLMLWTNIIF